MIDNHAGGDGSVALREIADAAQHRYATHRRSPAAGFRNYCTFTKVDLEPRGAIERAPGVTPQRVRRRRWACATSQRHHERWRVIACQRRFLADLPAGLDDEQWAHPSLCTQWRTKDRSASG
jgi:hypothetical protein